MFKRALTSSDFLELSTTKKIINDNNNVFLMGHNRHATFGAHTTENTHPFVNEEITLFHNGTLSSHSSLTPGKTFGVDSDAVSYILSQSTNKAESLGQLKGAYALVWYDENEESINFARNEDRSFYFGYIKNSKSLLYSSEKGLISWLAERNNIEIEKIEPLAIGKLVSIFLDSEKKVKVIPFTPYTAPTTVYSGYYSKGVTPTVKMEGVSTGDIIMVYAASWNSYNNANPVNATKYGYLKCHYKDDIYFNVSGISEKDKSKYLDKNYTFKITAITDAKAGYGTIIKELTDEEYVANKLKEIDTIEKDKVITIQSKKEEIKKGDLKDYVKNTLEKIGFTKLTKEELEYTDYSLVKGPGSTYISETDFLKRVQGGCSNCTDDILIMDAENTVWDYEGNPYCPECAAFFNIT